MMFEKLKKMPNFQKGREVKSNSVLTDSDLTGRRHRDRRSVNGEKRFRVKYSEPLTISVSLNRAQPREETGETAHLSVCVGEWVWERVCVCGMTSATFNLKQLVIASVLFCVCVLDSICCTLFFSQLLQQSSWGKKEEILCRHSVSKKIN